MAASAIQVVVKRVTLDLLARKLSPRELLRTKKVISQIHTKYFQNLTEDKTLRQDGLFSSSINERFAAEEIFEGVLLTAQKEYQEKKMKFQGNLFANIACDPFIGRELANLLLRLADRLSYRQLCILAVFVQQEKFALRDRDYMDRQRINNNSRFGLLQEIYALCSQCILFIDGSALESPFDIIPAKMRIIGPGESLYSLMSLKEIDESDINTLAEQLAQ